jgi:nucleotide-binding universal stress UspA family protein
MTSDPRSMPDAPRVAGPRCIVVAIDGSPSAARAADFAAGLACRNNAALIAVQVARPPTIWPDLGFAEAECLARSCQPAPEVEALVASMAREVGIEVELVVREGEPVREIAALANERRADLVVAGASASRWRRLTRPVSARLARQRAWPVVTVP